MGKPVICGQMGEKLRKVSIDTEVILLSDSATFRDSNVTAQSSLFKRNFVSNKISRSIDEEIERMRKYFKINN